ncbi:MAG TPA: COX15/CtaA family protein [Candidatus Nanopelagicaceae bacterium]
MFRHRVERALSPILGLLLFLQAGLVVTGGAVRLTGSGLGCPTWPECTHGSLTPVPHQAQGQLHAWIEFGNRLLAFSLVLTSLCALTAVLLLHRKDIRALAIGQVLGIFAQIPLGGITVLTHLNPIAVAAHFMLSIVLIAAGTSLFERRRSTEPHRSENEMGTWLLARAHLWLTATVIMVGTIVTGSGPNAGDISAPRFHIKIQTIAWIHADLVIALLGLTLWLYFVSAKHSLLRRRTLIFGAVAVAQGGIGFLQFYQGLPELLVGTHLLGVTLVWISAWRIHLASK